MRGKPKVETTDSKQTKRQQKQTTMALSTLFRNQNLCFLRNTLWNKGYLSSIYSISSLKTVSNSAVLRFQPNFNSRFEKMMEKDNIPQGFELVYRNPITHLLGYSQGFAILSGVVVVTLGVLFSINGTNFSTENAEASAVNEDGEEEVLLFGPEHPEALALSMAGLAFFCVSIQVLARKFPVRIYSNDKRFILVNNSLIPGFPAKSLEFKAGECSKGRRKLSIFNHMRYEVNGKDYLIFENHFKTSADYNNMMGTR